MNRTPLATPFMLAALFSVMTGVLFVGLAWANFHPVPVEPTPIVVTIKEPVSRRYFHDYVSLVFTVEDVAPLLATYSIDGQPAVSVKVDPLVQQHVVNVTGLSDGWHNLTASAWGLSEYLHDPAGLTDISRYGVDFANVSDSKSVRFFIDAVPPIISVFSPQNTTYALSDVPLNFTVSESVDEPIAWIGYSLDSQANVTITGNTMLLGLSNGLHSLKIYANETRVGRFGTSETLYFTVAAETVPAQQTAQQSFTATLMVLVSVAAAVFVGVYLVVYFRKQNWKQHAY